MVQIEGMTNTDMTATASEPNYFTIVNAHIESITPAHRAAFQGPVARDYQIGSPVWMYDHYNTARIEGSGTAADTWDIVITDADGTVSKYQYRSAHIRPAAAPVEFHWSA